MGQLQHGRITAAEAVDGPRSIATARNDVSTIGWISCGVPLALLLLSLAAVAFTWFWLGRPAALSATYLSSGKLDCVSYAPFRGVEDPLTPGFMASERQIAEDFSQLAGISDCIRTYSTGNGLDKVPSLARQAGLKVLLGIWIGTQPLQNIEQMETAIALANSYPDVVSAIVVGNEVMLRHEMAVADLARIVRSVKARVKVPVTYADVWDVWLRYRELADAVDFVTIHILPYWDDVPISAELAAAHVDSIRQRMAAIFPGKEIFIGETGWPSAGRMREGALPSRTNQARVIDDILALAKREHLRINLIEAYDQPWKRQWEGTVGGHWGLFESAERKLKYPAQVAVRDHPFWKIQMYGGWGVCFLIFGAAALGVRQAIRRPAWPCWPAVALMASVSGALLGMAVESLLLQSPEIGRWIGSVVLLVAAIGAPLLCANALMSGRTLPTFPEILGPRSSRSCFGWSLALGRIFTLMTLAACETALGLVFDPRYRDFPFASLTIAVVSCFMLRFFNRPEISDRRPHQRPLAEVLFAGLLGVSAGYIAFHEGQENWQSLWTCAAYLGLAVTLWLAAPHEAFSDPIARSTTTGSKHASDASMVNAGDD
jgi:exo-beta-1,3-glucanase (GH17 family)